MYMFGILITTLSVLMFGVNLIFIKFMHKIIIKCMHEIIIYIIASTLFQNFNWIEKHKYSGRNVYFDT